MNASIHFRSLEEGNKFAPWEQLARLELARSVKGNTRVPLFAQSRGRHFPNRAVSTTLF